MRIRRSAVAAVVGAGVLAVTMPLTAQAGSSTQGVALYADGTRIGQFDVEKPTGLSPIGGVITGLSEDDYLVGIDRRVQNGRLYGVGNEGGIYLMAGSRAIPVGRLSVALNGTSFGVDFNPAANALRIVSNTGQNLRQPFAADRNTMGATVVDGGLNYLAVAASGVAGAAYTNNDLNASTATTLFDLDTTLDQVALQSPANTGNLAATGKLGTDASAEVGFDIYSDQNGGTTVRNQGYAAIPVGPTNRFYAVDLLTGAVTYIGRFPVRVTDIAVDLDR